MRTAQQARQELEELRKRTQVICAVHAVLYALALALAAVGQVVPGAVIAGVNLLAYLLFLRKKTGGYSEAAARENILCGLCAPLEGASYTGRAGMTAGELKELKLLPFEDGGRSLLVRAAFSGNGFGLELGGCEFTLHYAAQGVKNKEYRFLSGTLLTAAPRSGAWEGDWLLLRRGLLDGEVQRTFLEENGFTPANCPEGWLNDRFQLYAGDGAQEMPRWLARRVSRAAEGAERISAVRLTPRKAAVCLENRFYTGRTKVRDLPGEEWLTHCPLPERDGVWELFRSLSTAETK